MSLVYADQTKRRHKIKTSGDGLMQVPADNYGKWTSRLLNKVMDKDVIEQVIRIVSAPFCVMQFINDIRCFPGDTTLEVSE